jgi:hypothetical protein
MRDHAGVAHLLGDVPPAGAAFHREPHRPHPTEPGQPVGQVHRVSRGDPAALPRLVTESGTVRQYDTRPGAADTWRRDAERARVGNQLAGPPARPALTNRSSCLWIAATGEVPRADGQLVAGNLLPGGRPQGRRRCAWACRQCARVDLLGAQPVGTTRRRSSIRPRAVHAARICRRSSAALSTVVTPRRTHTGPRAQSCRK